MRVKRAFLMLGSARCIKSVLALATLFSASSFADVIAVKHKEGPSHGFLIVRTMEGKKIATGDLIQTMKSGGQIVSRLVFNFTDGSVQDETTEFTQRGNFQLVSDHLVQKGPSFKIQLDASLNAATGEFTAHYQEGDGKQKEVTKHVDLPADVYNGLIWTLLKNLEPGADGVTVSMISGSGKPRLVKLHIKREGEEPFSVGGRKRKATHFTIKTEITGAAGVVAPLVGKQPPDTQAWILGGTVPTFLKSEGTFYDGGPIWRVELTSPVGPNPKSDSEPSSNSELAHH